MSEPTIFLITITSIFFALLLGFLVLIKDSEQAPNRYFFYLCASLSSYIGLTYISFVTSNLQHIRISLIGADLFVTATYLFARSTFTEKWNATLKDKLVVTASFLVAFLSLTPAVFSEVVWQNNIPLPKAELGIVIFGFHVCVVIILALTILAQKAFGGHGVQRIQASLVLCGLSIALLSGFCFIFLAVNVFHTTRFIPLALFAATFFVLLAGYSITRYRFFGIRVALRRSAIVFTISIVLSVVLFSTLTLILGHWPSQFFSSPFAFPIIVLISLLLECLRAILNRPLNYFFLREQIDLSSNLADKGYVLNTTHEIDTFVIKLSATIQEVLEAPVLLMLLHDSSQKRYKNAFPQSLELTLHEGSGLIKESRNIHGVLLREELSSKGSESLSRYCRRLDASLAVILGREDLPDMIIMIGQSKKGQFFSRDKLDALEQIVKSAESSLPNIYYWQKTMASLRQYLKDQQ